ncbi:MAG: hypothetical protein WC299_00660 [Kiritimatiellia bacterium]
MNLKTVIRKGFLATAGYFLSPLSWWNDLYVNLPIAYGMAWAASLLDSRLFAGALVFSYWATNIAGLIMLHKGLAPGGTGGTKNRFWIMMAQDLLISIAYTAVIVLFLFLGILKMPQEYFSPHPG